MRNDLNQHRTVLRGAAWPMRLARRAGFTLLESLMAAAILLIVVVAVTSALVAGQQHALEAQQRISGAIAAEELIGRLLALDYDELGSWDGHTEEVGEMIDINGEPFPPSFDTIGRTVEVATELRTMPGLTAKVRGREVRVIAFDATERELAILHCFIPEPAEDSQ